MIDLVSSPTKYIKGIPCNHPGCRSHLSHPCDGCGRYAAGLMDGPDIDAVMTRLFNLSIYNNVVYNYLAIGRERKWSNEQVLAAMLLHILNVNGELLEKLEDIYNHGFYRTKWQENKNDGNG